MKTCMVASCAIKVYARGVCRSHYARFRIDNTLHLYALPPQKAGRRQAELDNPREIRLAIAAAHAAKRAAAENGHVDPIDWEDGWSGYDIPAVRGRLSHLRRT